MLLQLLRKADLLVKDGNGNNLVHATALLHDRTEALIVLFNEVNIRYAKGRVPKHAYHLVVKAPQRDLLLGVKNNAGLFPLDVSVMEKSLVGSILHYNGATCSDKTKEQIMGMMDFACHKAQERQEERSREDTGQRLLFTPEQMFGKIGGR